ncbi:MAG: TCR/Tet family MFS transporter [Alphaproteobacteria bacterium]|nr:TCR/Tet family MFS transporter [Alphaproteobacteria bacterium]
MRVLFFIILLDMSGFGILLPSIMFVLEKMGAGPGYATLIIAMYSVGQFFAGPFWGQLSDRIGRKPVLLISMSGAFVAYLLMMIAKTPEMILASRILAGLMAGNMATAYAAVADLTPPDKRSKGMGVLGAAVGLGFVIGPAIGGFLGGSTPETATIFYPAMASAIMSLLAISATFFFFKESLSVEHREELKLQPKINRVDALRKVILHPVLKWFCIFIFLVSVAAALKEPVTPLLIGHRYGWGPRNMGYIFVVVGLVIAMVQGGLVGRLAKRYGEKNMIKIAMCTLAIGLVIIIYTPISYGVVLGLSFTGVSTTLFTTAISALVSHRAKPTERGLVMSVVQSMQSLGRSVGPLVAGSLFAFWEGLPYFIGIILAAAVFAGIVILTRKVVIEDASKHSEP